MLGPIVNAIAIVACSLAGRFLIRGIPERFEEHVKKAIGIAIIFVGVRGALANENTLLLVMSVIVGAVIGELVDIDRRMSRAGLWAERAFARALSGAARHGAAPAGGAAKPGSAAPAAGAAEPGSAVLAGSAAEPGGAAKPGSAAEAGGAGPEGVRRGRSFSKGFVSASVLFCSGSMAIVGSMQSGLQGNHELLFTKSVLDGSLSLIFGATFGIGAAFSAAPVLLYQGGIALAAMAASQHLTECMIREMGAVGSLIIAGIGFNFLEIREIKVANLIPAVFVPLAWLAIAGAFAGGA